MYRIFRFNHRSNKTYHENKYHILDENKQCLITPPNNQIVVPKTFKLDNESMGINQILSYYFMSSCHLSYKVGIFF